MLEKREASQIIEQAFKNIRSKLNNHIINNAELWKFLNKVELTINDRIKLK